MTVIDISFDPEATPPTPGSGGGALDPGVYHLKCTETENLPASSPTTYGKLKVSWEVVASETGMGQGRKSSNRFSFSPKAAGMFLRPYLDAAGVSYSLVPHPSDPKLAAVRFDTDDLINSVVKARTYLGAPNAEGKRFNEWTEFEVSQYAPQGNPARVAPPVAQGQGYGGPPQGQQAWQPPPQGQVYGQPPQSLPPPPQGQQYAQPPQHQYAPPQQQAPQHQYAPPQPQAPQYAPPNGNTATPGAMPFSGPPWQQPHQPMQNQQPPQQTWTPPGQQHNYQVKGK